MGRGLRGRKTQGGKRSVGAVARGAGLTVPAELLAPRAMAPHQVPGPDCASREHEDRWEARGDRKVRAGAGPGPDRGGGRGRLRGPGLSGRFPQARKPLVEKKRRARINESLQELRLLLAGAEVRGRGDAGTGWGAAGRGPVPCAVLTASSAGAGQAGERRGAGADGAARAGCAAGPDAR